jgi:hypothetical protein
MALPGLEPDFGYQPEWPGQHSGKFTDGTTRPRGKRIVETKIRNGDEAGLARNGFGAYFSDERGLVNSEGIKILPCPGSQVFEWRSSKRPIKQPGDDHYVKPEGRRLVESAPGKALGIREKRHIRQVESKEEVSDRPAGPQIVVRDNGFRAADQPAREVDISMEMQRRVKGHSMLDCRNGIGCKVYGEKAYKHPEYSGDFYKIGELVVGSGFQRGHYKKTQPRNATSVQLVEVQRKEGAKTFEERQQEMSLLEARTEVEELTVNWERSVLKTTAAAKYDEPSDSEDEAAAAPA